MYTVRTLFVIIALSLLCLGSLDSRSSTDVLVVGSLTHVLAYDVENNRELFHNEVILMYYR